MAGPRQPPPGSSARQDPNLAPSSQTTHLLGQARARSARPDLGAQSHRTHPRLCPFEPDPGPAFPATQTRRYHIK